MFYYKTQLKSHDNYPYQNWNTDVQDYILLNLFWINFVNQFNLENWEYGLSYYINFDNINDREFSTDVIYIKNATHLKILAISPITNYEKKFSSTRYYIGIFKDDDNGNHDVEYDMLSIGIDISVEENIEITKNFIEYFLSEGYKLEKMIEELKI